MSDKMRPVPFGRLMERALEEYGGAGSLFGVRKLARAPAGKSLELFGERMEFPCGPAAGPHTQLSQNIIAAYAAGGRFFELKTVQVLDGDDLPVSKPCILAADEGYNVEWSTELYVPQAFEEYVKAWFALGLLSRELGLGSKDGFIFNMSVGYDLEGIKTPKIDGFIEGMKNAGDTAVWQSCKKWALDNLSLFKNVDGEYIESISPRVCRSVTLSTLHGCPPDEIERIAAYLMREKGLNTFVKCNPTLLGYEYARETLDALGFGYAAFDDSHFKADLQFADAVPMLRRLMKLAGERSLSFGVKLTNTFPVRVTAGELPGGEMYMSGRALFPLSIALAARLSREFGGGLRISYSGGADAHNIDAIFGAGVWPVTVATTLLKPGGYQRLRQMSEKLAACEYSPFTRVDTEKLYALADGAKNGPLYRKPIKPAPGRKLKEKPPLLDCFAAPCRSGCPLGQDIPAYLRLAGEGKHLEALRVITERNPLPFITGTICSHRCTDRCARAFYEEAVRIREVKLEAAQKGYARLMEEIMEMKETAKPAGGKVAVIGGGPAGLAAAYFLARQNRPVTVFEKRAALGGIVRHVIPRFRIGDDAVDSDAALVRAAGAEVRLNTAVTGLDALRGEGFETFIIATGAWKPAAFELEGGEVTDVLEFLESIKRDSASVRLGENVAVIGGGNTAMDAARAAVRAEGVKRVRVIYRRTKRYMPADEEELRLAAEDGAELLELLSPLSLNGGKLTCAAMALGEPDASGRRAPVPTGKTVDIPADTVISAVGGLADAEYFKSLGIGVDEKGRPSVNGAFETNLPGVYAIGDAARGPSTVAEAIADALKCAEAITGAKADRYSALNINPDAKPAISKKGLLCLDTATASESERCLECATVCEFCADVCPNRANVAVSVNGRAQIIHIDALCNECGNCETFCPYSGAPYKDKFTVFSTEEDFADSGNQGFFLLEGGAVRVRLDGCVREYGDLGGVPEEVAGMIAEWRF